MELNVSPPSLINRSTKLNQAMVDPSLTQEVYDLYKKNG